MLTIQIPFNVDNDSEDFACVVIFRVFFVRGNYAARDFFVPRCLFAASPCLACTFAKAGE
jgi:hypothetical protein